MQRNAIFTLMAGAMIMVEPGCTTSRNLRTNDWSSSSSRDIIIAPKLTTLTVSFTVSPTLDLPGEKK